MNLRIRKLRLTDSAFCRELAEDPDVRAASLDPRPPTFWGHLRWMWRWTQLDDRHAFVIVASPHMRTLTRQWLAIGLVRAHRTSHGCEVGIVIDPRYRGQGYASNGLRAFTPTAAKLVGWPVYARIRNDNLASQNAFRAAGYVPAKATDSGVPGVSIFKWVDMRVVGMMSEET